MISVIIPAHNESLFLNKTIESLYDSCKHEPEVIVVDQGGNGCIDGRAIVVEPGANVGERVAMNMAAERATREFLFRIDAHCDFSPNGWDERMASVTGERDITVAVLTCLDATWKRHLGHWYGFAKIIVNSGGGIECKWQTPNKDRDYPTVAPNMGLTGCGFMIRKAFYDAIGGADETLPAMGAIGEEFAMKAWANGGKVQTRTDVLVGHVFGTGGYDTSGVLKAQQRIKELYGHCLDEVYAQFPEDWRQVRIISTNQHKPVRVVNVEREDVTDTTDNATNKLIRRRIVKHRYIWMSDEHPDELALTDEEIEAKYSPQAVPVDTKVIYYTDSGEAIET